MWSQNNSCIVEDCERQTIWALWSFGSKPAKAERNGFIFSLTLKPQHGFDSPRWRCACLKAHCIPLDYLDQGTQRHSFITTFYELGCRLLTFLLTMFTHDEINRAQRHMQEEPSPCQQWLLGSTLGYPVLCAALLAPLHSYTVPKNSKL